VWGVRRIPVHWTEKPLKHIVSINSDKLPDSTDPDFELEYVDIGNVSLTDGITSTERLRFETAPSRARRRVRHGDTIVSTVRTYLKAVAHIIEPPANLVVSTGYAVLRAKSALFHEYLYRLDSQQKRSLRSLTLLLR
jgi:type I restriction enzyme S subunit